MELRDNGSVWDTHHGTVGWGGGFDAVTQHQHHGDQWCVRPEELKDECHSGDFTIPKINLGTNTPIKGPASLFLGLVANRFLQRSGTGQRECCFSWTIHRVNKSLTPAVTLGREITARVQLVG